MRILFVVDGRSPIALNWIRHFSEGRGGAHEVHLVSTYPCSPELHLASFHVIPAAFGSSAGERASAEKPGTGRGFLRRLLPVGARTAFRQWLGPLTLPGAARGLADLVRQIQPDLVHAMRIPFEGMLAALALEAFERVDTQVGPYTNGGAGPRPGGGAGPHSGGHIGPPLLVSVWGNDFTLHARSNQRMAGLTRRVLRDASALHADCQRDIRLAHQWGFDAGKPSAVLPGGGGVQLDLFYPPASLAEVPGLRSAKPSQGTAQAFQMVINPRGFRAYVRNEAFFRAIPIVLKELPETRFVCPAMAGEPQAVRWVEALGIEGSVELLPVQSRRGMADLFRRSQIAVSPSTHDGTPNTLLEAMACGCFPVAGDIESLQEWITPGVNGMLVDPRSPQAIANAILRALRDPDLRQLAQERNTRLIAERAEYGRVMAEAERFYQRLISQ